MRETISDGDHEIVAHTISPTIVGLSPNDWHRVSARLHHAEEELECVHMWLDDRGAPRDEDGRKYTLVGRVMWLLKLRRGG